MKNDQKRIYIIAEAGVNHNGDEALAHELVRIAAKSGADAVKFQIFSPESVVTKAAPTAQYQAKNLGDSEISQLDMIRKLCLPDEAFVRIMESCKKHKIDFMCTPFDNASLAYLVANTQMPYLKLSSGELTNGAFLLEAARTQLPIILSTGMATLPEIETALAIIHFGYNNKVGFPSNFSSLSEENLADLRGRVILLHCVTQYPAPMESVNLRAMNTIRERFSLEVGISDHTLGITIPIAAVAMGAIVVEKHFTYDVSATGPDHAASLSPDNLNAMVFAIRDLEKAMGNGDKICQEQEKNTRDIARRSVVAAKAIAIGEKFSEENLTCKRPATGDIEPNFIWKLLGKIAKRSYIADDFIAKSEL
jgi:N-acetylneuraminate synthase